MIGCYERVENDEINSTIDVDLSLIDDAPDVEKIWLLWIFFKLSNTTDSPFQAFKTELIETLADNLDAVYAGSITKEGWCELYFYAPTSKKFENITSEVMGRHQSYPYERGSSKDTKWEMYLDRLYPEPIELIGMQNRETIAALLEEGDDLSKEREVEHYCFFQTPTACKRFAQSMSQQGFEIKEEMTNDESDYSYGVTLLKMESVTPDQIEETTSILYESTLQEHGIYEGWSTVLS